jgi:hypothetical protein
MGLDMAALLGYIDPGSGSLLLQLLIAGIIGSGVYFRNQVRSMLSWFRRKASPSEE